MGPPLITLSVEAPPPRTSYFGIDDVVQATTISTGASSVHFRSAGAIKHGKHQLLVLVQYETNELKMLVPIPPEANLRGKRIVDSAPALKLIPVPNEYQDCFNFLVNLQIQDHHLTDGTLNQVRANIKKFCKDYFAKNYPAYKDSHFKFIFDSRFKIFKVTATASDKKCYTETFKICHYHSNADNTAEFELVMMVADPCYVDLPEHLYINQNISLVEDLLSPVAGSPATPISKTGTGILTPSAAHMRRNAKPGADSLRSSMSKDTAGLTSDPSEDRPKTDGASMLVMPSAVSLPRAWFVAGAAPPPRLSARVVAGAAASTPFAAAVAQKPWTNTLFGLLR